ncbi:MAG: hypothetical protein R6W67_05035, partial [Bacteroidales bacterium]
DIDEFARDKRLDTMTMKEWAYLTPEGFKTIFGGTTVERRGYEAFMRNLKFSFPPPFPVYKGDL